MLIENDSHVDMRESDSAFNTSPSESESPSEDSVSTFSISPPFTTAPPFTIATVDGATDDDIDELRAEKRSFEWRKRRTRVAAGNEEVPVGEVGPDIGFDETGTAFRERITEQPNIRVFKLQEMIRKKFKLHVGKTTMRRTRDKVLKDIMDDHVVEFGRILDYKDELLKTNPGTSCVVRVGEHDAEGKSIF
ncbi:hypothetical protein MTR67_008968 [Solanum verrucosum]|uniref:Uncharacterized protein n=1 Tax=Solanum verrucosum TaxID=315347 RepID=A0AAF0Q317_SOLVR|nr:hypothetical protein MTR67_008968 [Solanum verrucosum]